MGRRGRGFSSRRRHMLMFCSPVARMTRLMTLAKIISTLRRLRHRILAMLDVPLCMLEASDGSFTSLDGRGALERISVYLPIS